MLKITSVVVANAIVVINLATLVSTVLNLKTFLAMLMKSLKSTPIDLIEFCLR